MFVTNVLGAHNKIPKCFPPQKVIPNHCANYRESSKVFHKKTFSASCRECSENASEGIKDVF